MPLKYKTLTVGPFAMNAYILWCSRTRASILVDPGDEVDHILQTVTALQIKPERLVLTHAHLDHVFYAKAVQERLKLSLYMHRDDEPLLARLPYQAQMFGLPAPEPPRVDGYLAEGDEIKFGEVTMKILHAPGHSPGSIVLYGEDTAVVGDVLFQDSIGRTDLPFGSYEALMRSIRLKLMTLPDHVRVLPGHGEETTIGSERQNNPFLQNDFFSLK
jgi:glyoxylase-like metal-dependent hydrolase (beta-lactamase superfamily II)